MYKFAIKSILKMKSKKESKINFKGLNLIISI